MKIDIDLTNDTEYSDEKATKVELSELEAGPLTAKITGFAQSEYGPMLFIEGNRFVPLTETGRSMKNLVRAFGSETDDWNGKTIQVKHHTYLLGKNKREQPGRLVVPVQATEQNPPPPAGSNGTGGGLGPEDDIPF